MKKVVQAQEGSLATKVSSKAVRMEYWAGTKQNGTHSVVGWRTVHGGWRHNVFVGYGIRELSTFAPRIWWVVLAWW